MREHHSPRVTPTLLFNTNQHKFEEKPYRHLVCFKSGRRMNCRNAKNRETGLTLVEVVVALVSVSLLLLFILPATTRCTDKAPRVKCSAGLKQVALGLILWANENQWRLPMEVSISGGGTREHALAGNLLPNYMVAANEIQDPRVLLCPSDKKRKPTTTFAKITSANISYFLNVEAAITNQNNILAGDRDIAFKGSPAKPGLLQISDANDADWASILHHKGGNLALTDGSVHLVTTAQFRKLLDPTATNRFILP